MTRILSRRSWVPTQSETFIHSLAETYAAQSPDELEREIFQLIEANRTIHERECVNLNPAANVMNPKAEAVLAAGLGTRPSLGYPGDKYEMGLEAIEKLEVLVTQLACEVFNAPFAEIRVPSGSLANLYAFMATCRPGDAIIVPPASIGGHVTHHSPGAAGLYGLRVHLAAVDPAHYTVDVELLREQARRLRPKLITVAGSLNLLPHPVKEIRAVADEVGAYVLYDAAHMSGMIAGRAWQQPFEEGAHLMTMSTYKSLGGPPSGLILTNEARLAERLDGIAFPGLTANFDAAKTAALGITLLDWQTHGQSYAAEMARAAKGLAEALAESGVPVFGAGVGFTTSQQFAVEARGYGGGQAVSKRLRRANILASGIGLPADPVEGDLNGLRLGTPEIVRWGMRDEHMPELAAFIGRALVKGERPEEIAPEVAAFRKRFTTVHFIR